MRFHDHPYPDFKISMAEWLDWMAHFDVHVWTLFLISKVSHYATCCVSRSGLCGMVGVTQFILFFGVGPYGDWWCKIC